MFLSADDLWVCTMSLRYTLSKNASFREFHGTYVLMDVRCDKYYTLSNEQSRWFAELIHARAGSVMTDKASRFGQALERKGFIGSAGSDETKLEEFRWAAPMQALLDDESTENKPVTLVDLFRYIRSLICCSVLLTRYKTRPDKVAEVIQRWKRRAANFNLSPKDDACDIAVKFHRLSPFFLTTHDACYFRSLALVKFLSLYGVEANCVFGVRLSPFGAHCWVEHERSVLNEHLERALEFKPINSV